MAKATRATLVKQIQSAQDEAAAWKARAEDAERDAAEEATNAQHAVKGAETWKARAEKAEAALDSDATLCARCGEKVNRGPRRAFTPSFTPSTVTITTPDTEPWARAFATDLVGEMRGAMPRDVCVERAIAAADRATGRK